MALELTPAQALGLWHKVALASVGDKAPDLSLRQISILLTVYLEAPPHTVRDLAAKLGVSKPVITTTSAVFIWFVTLRKPLGVRTTAAWRTAIRSSALPRWRSARARVWISRGIGSGMLSEALAVDCSCKPLDVVRISNWPHQPYCSGDQINPLFPRAIRPATLRVAGR